MKKMIITAAFLMAMGISCIAQSENTNIKVTKEGKTFTATSREVSIIEMKHIMEAMK